MNSEDGQLTVFLLVEIVFGVVLLAAFSALQGTQIGSTVTKTTTVTSPVICTFKTQWDIHLSPTNGISQNTTGFYAYVQTSRSPEFVKLSGITDYSQIPANPMIVLNETNFINTTPNASNLCFKLPIVTSAYIQG